MPIPAGADPAPAAIVVPGVHTAGGTSSTLTVAMAAASTLTAAGTPPTVLTASGTP